MAKKALTDESGLDIAQLLVDVADADTVYRDVYLRRAHALLTERLRTLHNVQRQLDAVIARREQAASLRHRPRVDELAGSAERAPTARRAEPDSPRGGRAHLRNGGLASSACSNALSPRSSWSGGSS